MTSELLDSGLSVKSGVEILIVVNVLTGKKNRVIASAIPKKGTEKSRCSIRCL